MADQSTSAAPRRLRALHAHLVLTGLIATGAFALVIGLSIFVPIAVQLGHTSTESPDAAGLAEYFLYLHGAFWPVIAVSMAGSIVTGSMLYNRMRAPIVRFAHCYAEIAAGRTPTPMDIRRTDYLTEEAMALNAMIRSIQLERSQRGAAAERLQSVIDGLAGSTQIPPDLLNEMQDVLKELAPLDSENDGESRSA